MFSLWGIVILLLPSMIGASPQFNVLIPNGDRVSNPCNRNQVWKGVGHENPNGGGSRNPFGVDFAQANQVWTQALCRMDSDGDGLTNGEELGDPFCVWTKGAMPSVRDLYQLTHPGICEPVGSEKCAGKNDFLTKYCAPALLQARQGVCRNVTTPSNGFLVQAALRQANGMYASGDTIEYKCGPGYLLIGNSLLTCLDSGKWSSSAPACQLDSVLAVSLGPVFCLAPPTPRNGFVANRAADQILDKYAVGEQVAFSCQSGYQISNRAAMTCLYDGSWSIAVPTCMPSFRNPANDVACQTPTVPNNAKIQSQTRPDADGRYLVGGFVMFGCQPGYRQSNSARATILCQRDGSWSSTTFACVLVPGPPPPTVNCTALAPPNNAYVFASSPSPGSSVYAVGDFIQYSCLDGFESDERPVTFCLPSGVFAPNATMNCTQKVRPAASTGDCVAPSLIVSNNLLQISRQQYYFAGNFIRYTCMSGYNTTDPLNVQCFQNGTWSSKLPVCVAPDQPLRITTGQVTCEAPLLPRYSFVVARSVAWNGLPYVANDWIQYACNDGYRMLSDTTQFCDRYGFWNGSVQCIEIDESELQWYYGKVDMAWNSVRPPIGAAFQVVIAPTDEGGWNAARPNLGRWRDYSDSTGVTCNQPVFPKNALIAKKEVPFNDETARLFPIGASFTFQCVSGYTMIGQATITCNSEGAWNNSPQCTKLR